MDRLRKFNDINGYEHGPAAEPEEQEALDEAKDQVVDLSPPKPSKAGRNQIA